MLCFFFFPDVSAGMLAWSFGTAGMLAWCFGITDYAYIIEKGMPNFFPADFIGYKNLNSYAAVHYTVSYVSLIDVQVDSRT